jgi:hypothetical protein
MSSKYFGRRRNFIVEKLNNKDVEERQERNQIIQSDYSELEARVLAEGERDCIILDSLDVLMPKDNKGYEPGKLVRPFRPYFPRSGKIHVDTMLAHAMVSEQLEKDRLTLKEVYDCYFKDTNLGVLNGNLHHEIPTIKDK